MDGTPYAQSCAVVTGAGSGIGRALCEALAAAGATVIAADIDGAAAETTVKGLAAGPRSAHRSHALDVRDAAAVQRTVDDVVAEHGRLDYLFNNAGIGVGGETDQVPLTELPTCPNPSELR